jgi:hypothetical protein
MEVSLLVKDSGPDCIKILRFVDSKIKALGKAGVRIKIILIRAADLDEDMVAVLNKNGFDSFPSLLVPSIRGGPLAGYDQIKSYFEGKLKAGQMAAINGGNGYNRGDAFSVRTGGRIGGHQSGEDYAQGRSNMADEAYGPRSVDHTSAGVHDYHMGLMMEGRSDNTNNNNGDDDRPVGYDFDANNMGDQIKKFEDKRKANKAPATRRQQSFVGNFATNQPAPTANKLIKDPRTNMVPQARGLFSEDDDNIDTDGLMDGQKDTGALLNKLDDGGAIDAEDDIKNWMTAGGD